MKTIERPDSTTVIKEILFHRIKNETELNNVLNDVNKEDILIYDRNVNDEFSINVSFFIRNKNREDLFHSLKYITSMDHMSKESAIKLGF